MVVRESYTNRHICKNEVADKRVNQLLPGIDNIVSLMLKM